MALPPIASHVLVGIKDGMAPYTYMLYSVRRDGTGLTKIFSGPASGATSVSESADGSTVWLAADDPFDNGPSLLSISPSALATPIKAP